jgi:membrane fusion protein, multidrug efflux system
MGKYIPSQLKNPSFLIVLAVFAIIVLIIVNKSRKIDVVVAIRGPIVQAIYATGIIESSIMLPIAAKTPGRLVEIIVDEGEDVEKGQVLAQLEDRDLQHALTEARARAYFLEKEYKRYSSLVKTGAVTNESVDRAKAEWEASQAVMDRITVELEYMQLKSSVDGRVIRRDGEGGELIAANQTVFWLSSFEELRVITEVDEEDISLIHPGQKVLIRADAFPDEVFHGSVHSITPKGDPISRSYRVRVNLEQNNKLMIGMTAETNFIVREDSNALLVPTRAVENNKIWIVEDNKLKAQPVTIGARDSDVVEILKGITEDSIIVFAPSLNMQEGNKVKTSLRSWNYP